MVPTYNINRCSSDFISPFYGFLSLCKYIYLFIYQWQNDAEISRDHSAPLALQPPSTKLVRSSVFTTRGHISSHFSQRSVNKIFMHQKQKLAAYYITRYRNNIISHALNLSLIVNILRSFLSLVVRYWCFRKVL